MKIFVLFGVRHGAYSSDCNWFTVLRSWFVPPNLPMISATMPDCEMSQGCVALISSGGMGARIAAGVPVAKEGVVRGGLQKRGR